MEATVPVQRLSSDVLSLLPQSITETILCLLPIGEAARTSILSRDWRYKWTTIPKLVFNESTMSKPTRETKHTYDITSARKNMDSRCKLFYAILQILLLRQGPIHEFTLSMNADHRCSEIDQIILHLSRNHTIKKLRIKLCRWSHYKYKLPLCAFSLHQLTDLNLCHINLDHQPLCIGFGNLRSLCLKDVIISAKALLHLLSNCPSLTSFDLQSTNLGPAKDCTIIELLECLPMIEHLVISSLINWLILDTVPKDLTTSLVHLKYFCIKEVWFLDDGLRFLGILIKCSPNLEKISLEADYDYDYKYSSGILEEYLNVQLEHLNELEIECFSNLKPEMEFVTFILAKSPKLKKVWISRWEDEREERYRDASEVLDDLLQAPRASSVVEIVVV